MLPILVSPPSRGAWIEIVIVSGVEWMQSSRPPRGGRGLKLYPRVSTEEQAKSPPSRGAWIEIMEVFCVKSSRSVAPLAGGVD